MSRLGFFQAACVLACVGLLAAPGVGQLSVDRLYHHVDRPLTVTVAAPESAATPAPTAPPALDIPRDVDAEPAPLAIELRRPVDGRPVARVQVAVGSADLAQLFPRLWKPTSVEPAPVYYAQLLRGDEPLGPALVLQPMLTPMRATAADQRGLTVRFNPVGPAYFAGYRVYVDQRVLIDTSLGEMEFALHPDAAPNTVWNFRELARGGFYDGTIFHRIIGSGSPGKGFMVQGGDPLGNGLGGPGFAIPLESSSLDHDFGVLSMARLSSPDTAGAQFFIALSRDAAKPLDRAYAAFGQLTKGAGVLRRLGAVRVSPDDRPFEPPVIRRVRLVDAPPYTGIVPEREVTDIKDR